MSATTKHPTLRTYLAVFALLMILLAVTVAAAFFIHAGNLNIVIAMTIALVKALLVILYFMHIRYSAKLTVVFCAASFLWLAILFALIFADYIARPWHQSTAGWNESTIGGE
jgi:cytochrome c oxidase subunit IV